MGKEHVDPGSSSAHLQGTLSSIHQYIQRNEGRNFSTDPLRLQLEAENDASFASTLYNELKAQKFMAGVSIQIQLRHYERHDSEVGTKASRVFQALQGRKRRNDVIQQAFDKDLTRRPKPDKIAKEDFFIMRNIMPTDETRTVSRTRSSKLFDKIHLGGARKAEGVLRQGGIMIMAGHGAPFLGGGSTKRYFDARKFHEKVPGEYGFQYTGTSADYLTPKNNAGESLGNRSDNRKAVFNLHFTRTARQ